MIPYLGCQGARDMLEPFVDGELPVSEQVALEAHLRWCDICRARVEDIRLIGSALRLGSDAAAADYTDAAAAPRCDHEVVTRVEAERTQSLAHQWRELFTDMRYLWPAFGATASVIVRVCASTLVNLDCPGPSVPIRWLRSISILAGIPGRTRTRCTWSRECLRRVHST